MVPLPTPEDPMAMAYLNGIKCHEAAELKLHADSFRELSQLPPNFLQSVGVIRLGRANPSEPKSRWAAGPESQSLHKRRPLHPLLQAEVDDVDSAAIIERLENGLVSREVREFEVGASLVKVHLENIGVGGFQGVLRVDFVNPTSQGFGELEVLLLDRLGASHQRMDKPNPGFLRIHQNRSRSLCNRQRFPAANIRSGRGFLSFIRRLRRGIFPLITENSPAWNRPQIIIGNPPIPVSDVLIAGKAYNI
nr:hypothetical protein TorRG33x02_168760 [Ipomoea batatas]